MFRFASRRLPAERSRICRIPVILSGIAALFAPAATLGQPADDRARLLVTRNGDGSVELDWSGDSPPYEVYRDLDAQELVDFANRLGTTDGTSWSDSPPDAEIVHYFVNPVGRCIYATADATVDSGSPDDNFGADSPLHVESGRFATRFPLMHFNLERIPAGSQILEASLQMNLDDADSSAVPSEITLVEQPWNALSVTWNNRPSTRAGFFATAPSATPGWKYWDATEIVQAWVSGTFANHGLAIEAYSRTDATFFSGDGEPDISPRLCVRYVEPRREGQQRLEEESALPPSVFYQKEETSFVSSRLDVSVDSTDPVIRALDYLYDYRDLYGLADPQAQLFLDRVENEGERDEIWLVTFGQRVLGRELVGSQLVVRLSGNEITGSGGNYLPAVQKVRDVPRRNESAAREAARGAVPGEVDGELGEPRLVYFNEGLLRGEPDPDTHLAWRFSFYGTDLETGVPASWEVWVSAEDGSELWLRQGEEGSNPPDKKFLIETAGNTGPRISCWDFPGVTVDDPWFDENGSLPQYPGPGADTFLDGSDAFDYVHGTYDYYHDRFGRHGWNDKDGKVHVMVHVGGTAGAGDQYTNAAFVKGCGHVQFGEDFVQPDLFAHEYSHAVDQKTAKLKYEDESGAIDESIADFFGSMLDFEISDGDWFISEDSSTSSGNCGTGDGAFRSLADPPSCSDPDHRLGSLSGDGSGLRPPPPGNKRNSSNDNGWVHTNSGIPNKVVYLITDGGSHNGLNIGGLRAAKAEQLVYVTHTQRLHKKSDFWHYRNEMVDVARTWASRGANGFTPRDAGDVINAWSSVGYGQADTDGDGTSELPSVDGDNDGLAGADDNCPNAHNAGQEDLDMDGVGDDCDPDDDGDGVDDMLDNCPRVANPGQRDTNGDGAGDVCDDVDGDGILSSEDNCPNVANRWQDDLDSDGDGDACDADDDADGVLDASDNCPRIDNPNQRDDDEDGAGNFCDNCRSRYNPEQADLDGDGEGDACDDDRDGDGILNENDNCPDAANPKQIDNDRNGVGLYCDAGELDYFDGMRQLLEISILFEYGNPNEFARFPVFPCTAADTCPDWLRPGFETRVDVRTEPALMPRIVDDEGTVLASASFDPSGQYTLRFRPDAEYAYKSPATELVPFDDEAALDTYEGRKYFLELVPEEGTEPGSVSGEVDVHSIPE